MSKNPLVLNFIENDFISAKLIDALTMAHKDAEIYNALYVLIHRILTLKCRPRCTVQTFNSSHASGLSATYSRECL
jgi:hypothetical protein